MPAKHSAKCSMAARPDEPDENPENLDGQTGRTDATTKERPLRPSPRTLFAAGRIRIMSCRPRFLRLYCEPKIIRTVNLARADVVLASAGETPVESGPLRIQDLGRRIPICRPCCDELLSNG